MWYFYIETGSAKSNDDSDVAMIENNGNEIKVRFKGELSKYIDYKRGKGLVINNIINNTLSEYGLNNSQWEINAIDGDKKIIKKNTMIIENILQMKKEYVVTFKVNGDIVIPNHQNEDQRQVMLERDKIEQNEELERQRQQKLEEERLRKERFEAQQRAKIEEEKERERLKKLEEERLRKQREKEQERQRKLEEEAQRKREIEIERQRQQQLEQERIRREKEEYEAIQRQKAEEERKQREREEFEALQRQKMEEERLQKEREREENENMNSAQIRSKVDNNDNDDGPLSFAGFAGMDEELNNDDNDYWMVNKEDLMESPENKFDMNGIDDVPQDMERNISNVSMENAYEYTQQHLAQQAELNQNQNVSPSPVPLQQNNAYQPPSSSVYIL